MSAEDLDNYETDAELSLYKEYRDVIKLFTYVVETERRFYLANKVDFNVRSAGQDVYFDVRLTARGCGTSTVPAVSSRRAHRHIQGRERRGSAENRHRHSRPACSGPTENQSSAEAVRLVFLLSGRLLSDLAVILCVCAQVRCAFPYLRVEYLRFCL